MQSETDVSSFCVPPDAVRRIMAVLVDPQAKEVLGLTERLTPLGAVLITLPPLLQHCLHLDGPAQAENIVSNLTGAVGEAEPVDLRAPRYGTPTFQRTVRLTLRYSPGCCEGVTPRVDIQAVVRGSDGAEGWHFDEAGGTVNGMEEWQF